MLILFDYTNHHLTSTTSSNASTTVSKKLRLTLSSSSFSPQAIVDTDGGPIAGGPKKIVNNSTKNHNSRTKAGANSKLTETKTL